MFYQIGRITVFSFGYVPVLERLVPSSGEHPTYELATFCLLASLCIGEVTGAAIISEIGDISKFDSPKKFAAYAGLDASVCQSGEFEDKHYLMSKRGSPYLRKATFQVALVASFKDPVLSIFYQKKRAALRT